MSSICSGSGICSARLRIAEALARDGIAVTLVGGGAPVALPRDPAIRFVQLPPVRALDARFELVDGDGRPIDDALRDERRAALLAAFAAARPDAVVIEGFPFARRAFRFELEPLIAAARAATAAAAPHLLGARHRGGARRSAAPPRDRRTGAARFRRRAGAWRPRLDPARGELPGGAARSPTGSIYTGYVAPPDAPGRRRGEAAAGRGLVSAGGGAAGRRPACGGARGPPRRAAWPTLTWRLLAGTNLPEADFAALARELRRPGSSSSASGRISPRCCSGAGCRSARPATTRCSTFWRRARAPSSCRLPRRARPSRLLRAERLAALRRRRTGARGRAVARRASPRRSSAPLARRPAAVAHRHRRGGALGPADRRDDSAGDSRRRGFRAGGEPGYDCAMIDLVRVDAGDGPPGGPIWSTNSIDGARPGGLPTLWWRDDDAVAATPQLDGLLRAGRRGAGRAGGDPGAGPAGTRDCAGARSAAGCGPAAWLAACRPCRARQEERISGREVGRGGRGRDRRRAGAPQGDVRACARCRCWCRHGTDSPPNSLPLLAGSRDRGAVARWHARRRRRCRPGSPRSMFMSISSPGGATAALSATGAALAALIGHLRARRLGEVDAAAPIGILTHHLIMDGATAAFLDRLVALTGAHAAIRWAAALRAACDDLARGVGDDGAAARPGTSTRPRRWSATICAPPPGWCRPAWSFATVPVGAVGGDGARRLCRDLCGLRAAHRAAPRHEPRDDRDRAARRRASRAARSPGPSSTA